MRHSRGIVPPLSLLTLGLAVMTGAAAEDLTALSIEELMEVEIVSAARLGQKSTETPASVSIIGAEDIRTFGWRTLAEALNGIRGLYVNNDRSYSYLGSRGFLHPNDYNSRVLIMIDGQRMNENIYDGGYISQEFLLDVDLVDRIEFVPGAGSTIYGANAFLGMINVVTKKGAAINGLQINGQAASFDTYQGRVSYGTQLQNGTDVLISASRFDSAGIENLYFPEYDSPATNNGIAHKLDGEKSERLFARLEHQGFTASAGMVRRVKQVPTAAYEGIFNDPTFSTIDRQFFGNLKYLANLSEDTRIQARGFYQGYDYSSDEAYDVDNSVVINRDAASGRWWGGELQLTTTALEDHRWLLGLEYQFDQRQHMFDFDIQPYLSYLDSHNSGHRVELFAQDDYHLTDQLIFSGGLRLNYHHMLDSLQLNPRFGLIWNPTDTATYKLLYSSTFRAPNVWERQYQLYPTAANPQNFAERIKSYQAVAEWRTAMGFKLTADLFYNHISHLLEQESIAGYGSSGPFVNADAHDIYGIELEAEKRWDHGRLFKISYTHNEFDASGHGDGEVHNAGTANDLFKLHYAEPLFADRAKIGIENVYIGPRTTPQGTVADGYYQLNISLTSDTLWRGVDLGFSLYNAFDSHYPMLGGTGPADIRSAILPGNGREFRFKLQLTF